MELCRDIWFMEMIVGDTAKDGREKQGVVQQPKKMKILEFRACYRGIRI
jgi:hypothetical protein